MEKRRSRRLLIIVEKEKAVYTKEKMQSAHIQMETFTNDGNWKEKINGIHSVKENGLECKCYIIGSRPFIKNVKKSFCECYPKAHILTDYENIDSIMEKEGIQFPKMSTETAKEDKNIIKQSGLKAEIDKYENKNFTEDEIAAFFLAKDELNDMKIFPPTNDNKIKALIKITKEYLVNPDKAESIVEHCLKNMSVESITPD